MALSTKTIKPKGKTDPDLVAVMFEAGNIMLRHSGSDNYWREKTVARLEAGKKDDPVRLIIRTDVAKTFGVQIVLDDGNGNQTPIAVSAEDAE